MNRYLREGKDIINIASKTKAAINRGDIPSLIDAIKELFVLIPYDLIYDTKEMTFHLLLHALFAIAGLDVKSEEHTLSGRIDILVKTEKENYIIELKVDGDVEKALSQIKDSGYSDKFLHLLETGVTIHDIAINFSSKKRTVDTWKEEIIRASDR